MTAFVLVHGGVHGSWCWDRVAEPLRLAGHAVDVVDLPGRPGDGHAHASLTLEDWAAAVEAAVVAAGADGSDVVLVGHSMGGMPTSVVAGRRADALARVVWIGALVPADGEAGLPLLQRAGPDCVLLEEGALVITPDGATVEVAASHAPRAFYGRCSDEDAAAATARICPDAVGPMAAPASLGPGFATIEKHYLGGTHDAAVTPALQRELADRAGATFTPVDADHSPFLSAPGALVTSLLALA